MPTNRMPGILITRELREYMFARAINPSILRTRDAFFFITTIHAILVTKAYKFKSQKNAYHSKKKNKKKKLPCHERNRE